LPARAVHAAREGITMSHFTPISAAIGGGLIGLSVVLLMVLNGRIPGITGIAANALVGTLNSGWRYAFLIGLVAAPLLWMAAGGAFTAPAMPANWAVILAAGLLVGFGTRLGNGCTSGHGVCGIARLSPRSLVATAAFMLTGFAVVALMRHGIGG
jgi:uncharacterized membrane protein YedE/YeeE